jgi:hypothetical protein
MLLLFPTKIAPATSAEVLRQYLCAKVEQNFECCKSSLRKLCNKTSLYIKLGDESNPIVCQDSRYCIMKQ